jgi:alpha-1,4-fucosyltransferase
MENIALKGYITEKIIDPLVSQSIPIYFGASDIKTSIPEDVFIHGQSYKSSSELIYKISSMTSSEIEQFTLKSCNFLKNQGNLYSVDSVARKFFEKIIAKIKHG